MPQVHCIVPARIGSSRFPRKPLVKLCGREMILRTLDRAKAAGCFSRIICATDSEEIEKLVQSEGYESVLTGDALTGSDRVAMAAKILNLDLVVNLQGDEPLVEISLLQEVVLTLKRYPDSWVSASSPLKKEDALNESVVKVKTDSNNIALDFSRKILESEISFWREHRGIYAYSAEKREEFANLPQNLREKQESLEQLRILGRTPIRIVHSKSHSCSVDLPSDAKLVEHILLASSTSSINLR